MCSMPPPSPPSSDVLHILLSHDAWGTRLILDLCRRVTREQFHQRFDIGPGSLHDTLTHMISAMRRWTDRLAGRTPRPMLQSVPQLPHVASESKDRTVEELRELHDEAVRDLASVVTAMLAKRPSEWLAETVTLDWPGENGVTKRYTFTKAAVLVHVCTHGMHHRAQCLNMLRRLNVPGVSDKLPDPSAVDWQAETELPPEVLS